MAWGSLLAVTTVLARLESRREEGAPRILRSAHVLTGARNVDWNTFSRTANALLDGPTLETIPIMEYIRVRTNLELVNEGTATRA